MYEGYHLCTGSSLRCTYLKGYRVQETTQYLITIPAIGAHVGYKPCEHLISRAEHLEHIQVGAQRDGLDGGIELPGCFLQAFELALLEVIAVKGNLFLRGKQVSKLSDTGLGYSDATNSQDSGYGARISFRVENGRFAVGPWLQYWKIDDSNLVVIRSAPLTYGLEPHNWTREIGVEVRYRF